MSITVYYRDNEENPLHNACKNGNLVFAKKLIKEGANMYLLDAQGKTPAEIALETNNYHCLRYLLKKGFNSNHIISSNISLLSFACFENKYEAVKVLLEHGAQKTSTMLEYSCSLGYKQIVKLLLEKDYLSILSYDSLCAACNYGDKDIVQLLIEHGIQNNTQELYNSSPLYYACLGGDYETVSLIINKFQIPQLPFELPLVACFVEYHTNSILLMELLIKNGENPHRVDFNGNNVLHYACKYNSNSCVLKYLIDLNVSRSTINFDEKIPLSYCNDFEKRDIMLLYLPKSKMGYSIYKIKAYYDCTILS